jgi:hypothetical protein
VDLDISRAGLWSQMAVAWCGEPEVGILGQVKCPLAGTLGEITFVYCLQPPGNPPNQELLVIRARLIPE